MLITELKPMEQILSLIAQEKIFLLQCHGCKEIHFPEDAVKAFAEKLIEEDMVTGLSTMEYICNPENSRLCLEYHRDSIRNADAILVFACGVGVQTIAEIFPEKRVYAGCDTFSLPGFQGVTPLEYGCDRCGTCYLNLTGGICPVTACAKGLLNGQCGGSKNGKCEVDPDMDCAWERITRRLKMLGRSELMQGPALIRDFAFSNKEME